VKLPLDLAIVYAAEQNFTMDLMRNLISGPERWEYEYQSYVQEAYELLVEDKQNYLPHDERYPLIRVLDPIGVQPDVESERAIQLLEIFHCYYRNSNQTWAIRPDANYIKDAKTIGSYLAFLTDNLEPTPDACLVVQ